MLKWDCKVCKIGSTFKNQLMLFITLACCDVINNSKEKLYMIILIDAEKAFFKNIHSKLGIVWNFLKLIKSIYKK